MGDVKCIDISHHQGTPDFKKVAADGVIAMIHKATQGTGNIDQCRADNIVNAKANGIACCTYHFLEHGDIAAQMQHYLDTVDPVEGERMVIDWEDWPGGDSWVDEGDLLEAVEYLLADTRNLQVTVYGSESKFFEHLTDLEEDEIALLQKTDLWVAHYGIDADELDWLTEIWPQWTLFQFSDQGSINGLPSGNVDLNEFNGTDENLVKWINPAEGKRPPRPKPEPTEKEVVMEITVPEGVAVSVYVNDEQARPRSKKYDRNKVRSHKRAD